MSGSPERTRKKPRKRLFACSNGSQQSNHSQISILIDIHFSLRILYIIHTKKFTHRELS